MSDGTGNGGPGMGLPIVLFVLGGIAFVAMLLAPSRAPVRVRSDDGRRRQK